MTKKVVFSQQPANQTLKAPKWYQNIRNFICKTGAISVDYDDEDGDDDDGDDDSWCQLCYLNPVAG